MRIGYFVREALSTEMFTLTSLGGGGLWDAGCVLFSADDDIN